MAPSPTTPTPSPLSPQTPTDYSNIPTDVLINNLTVDYDSVNAMATPWIDGTPTCTNNLPEKSRVIDNPIRNFDNYGIAYPIMGKLADPTSDRAGGKQGGNPQSIGPVAPNGYYQGPDYSLGSNYFEVMGKCGADSDPECVGADRAVYIRNITTGRPPLFGDESLASITGSTKFLASNGIIPTVLDNLSTFLPGNLIENVFENTGNFGGSKCRRVKLPVGAHIYDPTMKMQLDYCAINECDSEGNPPNLKVRQARTRKQVESMVSGVPYTPTPSPSSSQNANTVWWANNNQNYPRSWWFEEHCSPSFHYAVVPDDWIQNPSMFADCANGESTALPSAKPLLSTAPSLAQLPPAPTCSPPGSCPAQAPYSPTQAPTPAQINACQNQQAPFEGFASPTIQPTKSSHTLHSLHTLYRVILIIVIVVLIALLGWWWFHTSRTR